MRKRTAYTFKEAPARTRKIILERDSWKSIGILGFLASFLLAYYLAFAFFVLPSLSEEYAHFQFLADASAFVDSIFPDYFPILCSWAIFSILLTVFLDSGVMRPKELIYIIDSLVEFNESKESEKHKELGKVAEYLAGRLVTKLGELILYAHQSIREVDLGQCLSPTLLALFWGNHEEKIKAKELLSELQKYLKEAESQRQVKIVNWLSKSKKIFPRLTELKDSIKFESKVKKGILSATPERLRYIAAIATIVSAIVSIVGLMLFL